MEAYANQLIATLLVSLRIAPTFAFAPPFTLLRMPASVRVLLGLALAFWLVAGPGASQVRPFSEAELVPAVLTELLLGISLALSLQIAFAAMLTAGRAIDIQAGFGLAQVADPTYRSQMPLVGTLFAYAAGAIFFATGGPGDLLAIWSQSLERMPLGQVATQGNLEQITAYICAQFALALGLAGLVLLVLFLLDLTVAFMSRTLPQMNVLVLGFQLKTLALLVTLPFVFAFSGALFLRMLRLAIDTAPDLI